MAGGKHFRAFLVAGFSATGGFLFGYHIAVISGVITMKDFRNMSNIVDGMGSDVEPSNGTVGLIVGISLFGCFLGSLMGGQTSDRFSRKYSISFFSFLFTSGAAIQMIRIANGPIVFLSVILVGRFVAGVAIGALSMIVPMYHSEIAATKVRGRLITLHQWAITFGIATSFWVNFTAYKICSNSCSTWEWRIPLGLQIVPSLILAIGILFCPFSPRWLISHDREDEARNVLRKIRSSSDDEIDEELDRMKVEVAFLRENEMESYGQLFHAPLLRPLLLGVGIQILQQLTGINTTIYYAPRLIQTLQRNTFPSPNPNDTDNDPMVTSLIATGVYGCVNFLFTIPTIIFIDKLGRRILLITGAIIMSISMLIVAITMAVDIKSRCPQGIHNCTEPMTTDDPYFWVILVFLHLFVAGYAFSWGPVPWIYCTEIFSLTMRAKATSLTTAANWAINCIISLSAPTIFYKIDYGLFLSSSIICAIMIGVVYLFYPETKDKHLEEAHMFERDRIFVPEHLEDRRKHYHTFPSQLNDNLTRTLNRSEENSINESNQIHSADSLDQPNDCYLRKNIDSNENIN